MLNYTCMYCTEYLLATRVIVLGTSILYSANLILRIDDHSNTIILGCDR